MKASIERPRFVPIELKIMFESQKEFDLFHTIASSNQTIATQTQLFSNQDDKRTISNLLSDICTAMRTR